MADIVYLCSDVTLPGSPRRRSDAFEHDQMMDALRPAFARAGLGLVDISWDNPETDWSTYAGVIIGTTWDYWDRHDEFLAALDQIAARTHLFNAPNLVRWNSHKAYLREMEGRGAPTIPTRWLDDPNPAAVTAAFDALETDDLVLKRQVGAGADGQYRLARGAPLPPLHHPMMAQAFLPSILSEGEYSFVFIDNAFSHALIKRAAPGDYRIQSTYGGREEAIMPDLTDIARAAACLTLVPGEPLYARVDMVRGASGALCLMEVELIEPFLYPLQGPELGERLARGVKRRLDL